IRRPTETCRRRSTHGQIDRGTGEVVAAAIQSDRDNLVRALGWYPVGKVIWRAGIGGQEQTIRIEAHQDRRNAARGRFDEDRTPRRESRPTGWGGDPEVRQCFSRL